MSVIILLALALTAPAGDSRTPATAPEPVEPPADTLDDPPEAPSTTIDERVEPPEPGQPAEPDEGENAAAASTTTTSAPTAAERDAAQTPDAPPSAASSPTAEAEGETVARDASSPDARVRRRARARRARDRAADIVGPTVLLEADYRQRAHEVEGTSGFAFARARLGVRVLPVRWMTAVVAAELIGDHGPYLLDGFAAFTPTRWLELVGGYSAPPLFASFRREPVHTLPMPMRSPVVNEMRIRRDLGVEARVRPHRAPVEAVARLGNGAPGLLGNDNVTPTGYAALDLALGRAWVAGKRRTFGLRVGVAGMLDDSEDHDSVAGRTPLGFTYVRPVVAGGLRSIAEGHAIAYAGPVRAVVEGAMAHESRRADHDGNAATPPVAVDAVRSWGLTGEVTWTIRGTWRTVGTQPAGPGRSDGRWDGGALELSGRVDRLWLGRGTPEVANGGGTIGSLSLKWWPTGFLALDLYGDATRFDTAPVETPDRGFSWTALVRGSFFWGRSVSP